MSHKEKVYLAGGMKSGWQKLVINKFKDKFDFINPFDHGLDDSSQYTLWDLHYLKCADIVFAYMEETNPSGFGLSLEIGYAKALNKTIILIDEKSSFDLKFSNRFKIVKESASVVFNDFNSGLNFLNKFSI